MRCTYNGNITKEPNNCHNLVAVWPRQAGRDEEQDAICLSQPNGRHQQSLQNAAPFLGQVGYTVTLRIVSDLFFYHVFHLIHHKDTSLPFPSFPGLQ